jgi:hypothetical protein
MKISFDTKKLCMVLADDSGTPAYGFQLNPDTVIDVDGVNISLQLLAALANPDPHATYRMARNDDNVTVFEQVMEQQ